MAADTIDGIVIGEAERGDILALAGLLQELLTQERDFTPNLEKQANGLRLILDQPERGRIFVARRNEEVAGMANALFTVSTAEGRPVALLEDVIVSQRYRGPSRNTFSGVTAVTVMCKKAAAESRPSTFELTHTGARSPGEPKKTQLLGFPLTSLVP